MSLLKSLLLNCYYYGSYPRRARFNARLRADARAPVMVLFYHRISDLGSNSWTASNTMFERHVRWLKRHFDMVTLGEAQRRLKMGSRKPCVAITFDDGYAENCERALPLLFAERVPFTYFVTTEHVLSGRPFPHDVAAGRPLKPNTPGQIRELAAAGVEIGSHTRTHADLGALNDPRLLTEEIVDSRDELEQMISAPVRYFAFPYGQRANLSRAAFRIARRAGYLGVCSAYGGFNFPGDDPFHLQRIHADDDMIRLKNWMGVDPRKVRLIDRFEYEEPDQDHRDDEISDALPGRPANQAVHVPIRELPAGQPSVTPTQPVGAVS